jgi:hypothetical protein
MANPYHHAVSSVRRWGGVWQDYHAFHAWFDESKGFMADVRHRALRHHAEGIMLAERIFGPVVKVTGGREVPTRFIGEQHVIEDLGRIPSMQDWFEHMTIQPWMQHARKLSRELELAAPAA